jgi:hypothetical protein
MRARDYVEWLPSFVGGNPMHPILCRTLLPLLLGTLAAASQASTLNTAQIGVTPSFTPGSGPYEDVQNNNGPVSVGGSATGGFNSTGSGSTYVDWGVIKLSGDAVGSMTTVTRGIFRDDLMFTAPGVAAGTFGTLTFWLAVNGTLQANDVGTPQASWGLQADLGGGYFDINRSGSLHGSGPYVYTPGYVGDPFGLYSATVTFQFGFNTPLDVELTGSAQAAYSFDDGLPTASFDLAHSLYWGGITDININGTPVGGVVIASASGTDYSVSLAPVPEPGAAVLLLAGLPLIAWRLQRARLRA